MPTPPPNCEGTPQFDLKASTLKEWTHSSTRDPALEKRTIIQASTKDYWEDIPDNFKSVHQFRKEQTMKIQSSLPLILSTHQNIQAFQNQIYEAPAKSSMQPSSRCKGQLPPSEYRLLQHLQRIDENKKMNKSQGRQTSEPTQQPLATRSFHSKIIQQLCRKHQQQKMTRPKLPPPKEFSHPTISLLRSTSNSSATNAVNAAIPPNGGVSKSKRAENMISAAHEVHKRYANSSSILPRYTRSIDLTDNLGKIAKGETLKNRDLAKVGHFDPYKSFAQTQ